MCKFGRRNSCRIRDTGVNLGGGGQFIPDQGHRCKFGGGGLVAQFMSGQGHLIVFKGFHEGEGGGLVAQFMSDQGHLIVFKGFQ